MGRIQENIGMTLIAGGLIGTLGVLGAARKDDAPFQCGRPTYAANNHDECYEEGSVTTLLVGLGSLASIAAGATLCAKSGNKDRDRTRRPEDIDEEYESLDFDGD